MIINMNTEKLIFFRNTFFLMKNLKAVQRHKQRYQGHIINIKQTVKDRHITGKQIKYIWFWLTKFKFVRILNLFTTTLASIFHGRVVVHLSPFFRFFISHTSINVIPVFLTRVQSNISTLGFKIRHQLDSSSNTISGLN